MSESSIAATPAVAGYAEPAVPAAGAPPAADTPPTFQPATLPADAAGAVLATRLRSDEVDQVIYGYERMQNAIISWGRWDLLMGVIQIASSLSNTGSLSGPWGVVLLLVGASSMVFREAPMFVVYAVTMAWAAVTNLLSGGGALVFALFQLYLTFQIVRSFLVYRRVETAYNTMREAGVALREPAPRRVGTFFPWGSLIFGGLSFTAFCAVFTLIVANSAANPGTHVPAWFNVVIESSIDFGALALALGLAGLLGKTRERWISVFGLVPGVLTIAAFLALIAISRLT